MLQQPVHLRWLHVHEAKTPNRPPVEPFCPAEHPADLTDSFNHQPKARDYLPQRPKDPREPSKRGCVARWFYWT